MSVLTFELRGKRDRLGLKGPRAAEWLVAHGLIVPTAANTWTHAEDGLGGDALLVARLGSAEFFLEERAGGDTLGDLSTRLDRQPAGVYAVLREDWAFMLKGARACEVLTQVCNVNFADLALQSRPLIMTLMIGVAVLVVPAEDQFRIWCDPTFGPYLGESMGAVVLDCGGRYTGVSA
jgi:sarcosine oxidase, subunit gamma